MRRSIVMIVAVAGLMVVALTGLALASGKTLKSANNVSLGKPIVVDSNGMTVYELKPETTKHLLCKSQTCFGFWPPYKVSKNATLTKPSGIKGKLGKLHRDGFYQVTLGGIPLYHYGGDHKKGDAKGNGIKGFGGTWHVVNAPPNFGHY
jgi:predicted lipoprotein with Yx(FWY)xxD motif